MAEIVIAGNTSGSVTLVAPSIAGTTTLTLPASSGTVLDDASVGVCRAWVNFNGTDTVAIRAAFNVSSITDLAVGNYSVNFTNNMVDSDFSAGLSVKLGSDSYAYAQVTCSEYRYPSSRGVGFIKVNCTVENGGVLSTPKDPEMYSVQIFR